MTEIEQLKKQIEELTAMVAKSQPPQHDEGEPAPVNEYVQADTQSKQQYKPVPTFFFKRPDGTTFFAEEKEATDLYKQRKFEYIGNSDGTTYKKIMAEAKGKGVIPREEAQVLVKKAQEAELQVAINNPEKRPPNYRRGVVIGDPNKVKVVEQMLRAKYG